MQQVPLWVLFLSALLTPTIAVAGGIIAWFQWLTNETKRKQDLFDRRFDFYKRAVSSYEELWSERAGTTTAYEFEYFCTEASFLFGPDLVQHLKTMSRHGRFDLTWFTKPFRHYMQFR
jgi:hypothetical protein